MDKKIKVLVCGAAGSMGKNVVRTVLAQDDMKLVGAIDINSIEKDAGVAAGTEPCGVLIKDGLEDVLVAERPDVMIDFTKGHIGPNNILMCLEYGVKCVVGTTGMSGEDLGRIDAKAAEKNLPVLIAPNFSIGAVMMMQFASQAAQHFKWAEIIELHHERKADAPSGTALRTATMMKEAGGDFKQPGNEREKIKGVRGGMHDGVRVHSVRLQGLLAHQEVILGGPGETLTIRHDSLSRECFMPGVMVAVRNIDKAKGVTVGLEHVISEQCR